MTKLTERLRAIDVPLHEVPTMNEAADRIEQLEAALQAFASPPLYVFDRPEIRWVPTPMPDGWIGGGWLTATDFAIARQALEGK